MAYRSNLSNLIADAFAHREGEATASDRKWRATRMGNYVGVEHHATHMFNVTRGGVVEPVDPGYGGQSDTAGVRKITSGYGCVGTDCGVAHKELFYDKPETRGGYRRLEGSQWRNAIQRDPELRATPDHTQGLGGSRSTNITFGPTGEARIGEARRSRSIRGVIGDPVPAGRPQRFTNRLGSDDWVARDPARPSTHSGLPGDDFSYSDMNRRGPNYNEPDPFDFSDPEEARQAQSITDMEETLRGLDERSQRPRSE